MTASVQIRVPDLSLNFNEDAEPDPAFHLYLDPAFHSNADPDPQPCCKVPVPAFFICRSKILSIVQLIRGKSKHKTNAALHVHSCLLDIEE